MNLFSLSGTLKLDTSDFVEKLNDARKSVDEFVKYLQSVGKGSGLDGVSETAKDAGDAVEDLGDKTEKTDKKTSNFQKTLEGIQTHIENVGDKIKNTGDNMRRLGDSMEKIFSPVANVARDAIDGWIEYESAFTGVRKTSEGTEEQFAALDAGIRALSTTTASSKVEIAGAAEVVGQLTDNIEDVLPITETAIKIADTTNLSLNDGATSLTRLMTIMGDGGDAANAYGSALVELGNNMATDEKQIMNMALRIAGAGNQVGMTGDQVLALSAGLSSLGIRAEAGGSSISRVLLSMGEAARIGVEPTQELLGKARDALIEMKVAAAQKNGLDVAAEDFADLTVSVRDLQLMMENSPSDFRKLADAMGMTKTEVAGIIDGSVHLQEFADIAGVSADEFAQAIQEDAYSALLMFLGGLGELDDEGASAYSVLQSLDLNTIRVRDSLLRGAAGYEEMTKAASLSSEAFERGAALEEEAALRYGTTESRIHQLKETFSNLAIEVGEKLMPLVEKAMEWGYKIIDFLDQLPDGMLETIATIGLVGAAIGTVISAIGGVVSAVGTITSLLGALASPGGVIFLVVAAIAAVAAVIITHWDEISAWIQTAISDIGDFFSRIGEWFRQAIEDIGDFFSRIIDTVSNVLSPVTELIGNIWGAAKDTVQERLDSMKSAYEEHGGGVEGFFAASWEAIKGYYTAAWDFIDNLTGGKLSEVANAVGDWISALVEAVSEFISNILKKVEDLISNVIKKISDLTTNIVNKFQEIKTGVLDKVKKIKDDAIEAFRNLVESIRTKIQELPGIIIDKFNEAVDFIKNLPSQALSWGRDIIQNFIDGVTQKWNDLKQTVSNVADTVKSFLGFSEPEKGPLSNFHTYAPDMMKLFAQGIRENEGLVTSALEDSFNFSGVRSPAFGYSTAPMSAHSLTGGGSGSSADERPINIVVQSVLDGKVIGESTYKYAQQRNRVLGRAFA